jgi:hypothetical protein
MKFLHVATGEGYSGLGSSDAPVGNREIWKIIWKSKLLEKVRIFAWRALQNSLATELNKCRCNMPGVFHTIKNKRQGNRGICAVKLNMHKAYDRVEWHFLRDMMVRLGFDQGWVNLIMSCVSSVNYRVWFNSEETETFTPSRGIRQGDPLSPYLFLICAEGLSSLLAYEEMTGGIKGIKVCRDAPSVSRLLFADDSLILMSADMTNATALHNALDLYCASSGQLVSDAKSSIFFSLNTNVLVREEVCVQLTFWWSPYQINIWGCLPLLVSIVVIASNI